VFWNVLTNAVKFTANGGRIAASLHRSNGEVEIAISDTGAGITPAFLPFVFEPFRQAESRINRRQGLGLGLAITKQLVELQGGEISFPAVARTRVRRSSSACRACLRRTLAIPRA